MDLRIECEESCGKSFQSRKSMKTHVSRVHITPKFQCDLCEKFFQTSGNNARHVKRCLDKRRQTKAKNDTPSESLKRKRTQSSSAESPVKKRPRLFENEDTPMKDLSSSSRDIPSTSQDIPSTGRDMPSTSGTQKVSTVLPVAFFLFFFQCIDSKL